MLFLQCWFREFSIGSTNYPQIDIFLYSHHLSGWYCKEKFCLGHSWKLKGLEIAHSVFGTAHREYFKSATKRMTKYILGLNVMNCTLFCLNLFIKFLFNWHVVPLLCTLMIYRAQLRSFHQGQPLPSSLSILESTPQVRGLHAIIRLVLWIFWSSVITQQHKTTGQVTKLLQ